MPELVRFRPELVDPTVFIAPTATVLGDVVIHAQATIWFGTVVRADTERVSIGRQTNVQDLSVLHADPGFPCRLGDRVTVGHGAIVHGAEIEDEVMIGMRATILNGVRIGKHSIVAAGALVPEGKTIPAGSLVMGVPGKVVRAVTEADLAFIQQAALHYVAMADRYRS